MTPKEFDVLTCIVKRIKGTRTDRRAQVPRSGFTVPLRQHECVPTECVGLGHVANPTLSLHTAGLGQHRRSGTYTKSSPRDLRMWSPLRARRRLSPGSCLRRRARCGDPNRRSAEINCPSAVVSVRASQGDERCRCRFESSYHRPVFGRGAGFRHVRRREATIAGGIAGRGRGRTPGCRARICRAHDARLETPAHPRRIGSRSGSGLVILAY